MRWRLLAVTLLAMFLVWEVITRSVAAYLADVSPETAIRLKSTNSTALLNLADGALNPGQTPNEDKPTGSPSPSEANASASNPKESENTQDLNPTPLGATDSSRGSRPQASSQIRSWAKLALRNDPLNARAFTILGQLSERTADQERAKRFMQTAVRRSLHQSRAVYWMMRKSYEDQDYRAAMRHADTILRTRIQVEQYVMPMLGRMADNAEASGELKQHLASNPPWRPRFFQDLPDHIADARTPLDIFLSLRETPTPPSVADIRNYLHFLTRHGFYELAYYAWLQFLPPEQLNRAGFLFNASFETTPSGTPFDWEFHEGSGVAIKLATLPDGEHALFIEFGPGRVDFGGVKQLVYLPPGNYTFQGKYEADLVSQRGLQWSVKCAGGTTTSLGTSRTVNETGSAWKALEFSFSVPSADCPAQYVELTLDARSASEKFISGSVWYDELQVLRESVVDP